MAIKQIVTDDLTGKQLPDGTAPVDVRVDGDDYQVYLSDESKETFLAFLRGEAPILATARPARASTSRRRSSNVDSYGYEAKAVREWAQANNIKVDGKPVGDRGRIQQEVYDAYKESQS